jgi:hypothetical protein
VDITTAITAATEEFTGAFVTTNPFNLDNFIVKYYILLNDREEKY